MTAVAVADQGVIRAGGALNRQVVERLRETQSCSSSNRQTLFRVSAYRRAAETVAGLKGDMASLLECAGIEGLDAPDRWADARVGAIAQMVRTGRWAQRERLHRAVAPEQLFQSVPGLGPQLAHWTHEHLHVEMLEALEPAAHVGQLERVSGIGPWRAPMLRATLPGMLARARPACRQRKLKPGVICRVVLYFHRDSGPEEQRKACH